MAKVLSIHRCCRPVSAEPGASADGVATTDAGRVLARAHAMHATTTPNTIRCVLIPMEFPPYRAVNDAVTID